MVETNKEKYRKDGFRFLRIAIAIILVKDFNLILKEDVEGNGLSIIIICLSFTELVHNIVFIIFEKVQ